MDPDFANTLYVSQGVSLLYLLHETLGSMVLITKDFLIDKSNWTFDDQPQKKTHSTSIFSLDTLYTMSVV